jgi:hypothetical protein
LFTILAVTAMSASVRDPYTDYIVADLRWFVEECKKCL